MGSNGALERALEEERKADLVEQQASPSQHSLRLPLRQTEVGIQDISSPLI